MNNNKDFMLCATGDKVRLQSYDDGNYIAEIKEDGRRAFIQKKNGIVSLIGRDPISSAQYPEIVRDASKLKDDFILDCEIIVRNFKSDFGLLLSRDRTRDKFKLGIMIKKYPAVARVFDIIELNGVDLRGKDLMSRKTLLNGLGLTGSLELVGYTEEVSGLFRDALASKEEGIVIKAKKGTYLPNKREWVKVKRVLQSDIQFNGYEVNPAGITVTDNRFGFRCLVAGQSATEVKRLIDTQGFALLEVNHLGDPGEDGMLRQITFSKIV